MKMKLKISSIIFLTYYFLLKIDVSVAERLCYECNGRNCTQSLSGFMSTTCSSSDELCVTFYNNFTPIKRGCYGSLNSEEQLICYDLSNLLCSTCAEDNCNYLGREDHKCHYCSSVVNRTCLTDPTTTPIIRCPAPLYDDQPSCYIKAVNTITERGCIVNQRELDDCLNENNTRVCGSCLITDEVNSCNAITYPEDRRKCIKCSGSSCLDTSSLVSDFCDYADDDCVETFNFGVKRSCFLETSDEEREYCFEQPERCIQCMSNDCNIGNIPGVMCKSCSSSIDENCTFNPEFIESIECKEGCASILSTNKDGIQITQRMCYDNLSVSEKETCDSSFDSDSSICRKCLGDNCNSVLVPESRLSCFKCANGNLCGDQLYGETNVCKIYDSKEKCVAIIKSGNITQLGCYSELTGTEIVDCITSTTCIFSMCNTNDCNNPSLFQTPLSCVQCHSSNDEKCTTEPQSIPATPCKSGSSVDFCYNRIVDTFNERGCYLDMNSTNQQNCGEGKQCDVCRNNNGCNNKIFPVNRRYCHQCDSRTKLDCANKISDSPPTICKTYYEDTKCYSVIRNDGVALRQCSNGRDGICSGANKCDFCDGDGCNSMEISNAGRIYTHIFMFFITILCNTVIKYY